VQNLGSISGANAIDLSNGTQILATLTGATSFSFTGLPSAGKELAFSLRLTNVETITWPAGTKFANGAAPSPTGTLYEIPCSINSAGDLIVYGLVNDIAT